MRTARVGRYAAAVVLFLSHFVGAAAIAADVTGRIVIEPAGTAAPPPAGAPGAPATPGVEPSSPARPVVYVESMPAPAGGFSWPKELESARVEMRALAFHPREVAVRAGGSVAFANEDDLFHQPFSCSRGNRFDLGRFRKGEAPTVTFPEPGVARVYCEVHAGMRAFVLVAQNPFVAAAAADGTFRIPNVPPGRHRLAVVFEGDVLARRDVDVPASGEPPPPALEWRVASAPESREREKTALLSPFCCGTETPVQSGR